MIAPQLRAAARSWVSARARGFRGACRRTRPLAALAVVAALSACNEGQSDARAAVRLPSQTDGQAMVRLPAAGTAGAREALSRRPSSKKKRGPQVSPTSRAHRPSDAPVERSPRRDEDEIDKGADADTDTETRDKPRSAGLDVRDAPEGTPAAIARVFRRLPVSVHDGPPVGGIGASGVHIDRIWLGSKRTRDGCSGKDNDFSIGGGDEVNVCFRVVHGRVQEDVDVIWEKDGDLAQRRRGVTILPLHAYRTRSYLVLRNEYVGSWRVRIFSEDGVELATKTFNVVE